MTVADWTTRTSIWILVPLQVILLLLVGVYIWLLVVAFKQANQCADCTADTADRGDNASQDCKVVAISLLVFLLPTLCIVLFIQAAMGVGQAVVQRHRPKPLGRTAARHWILPPSHGFVKRASVRPDTLWCIQRSCGSTHGSRHLTRFIRYSHRKPPRDARVSADPGLRDRGATMDARLSRATILHDRAARDVGAPGAHGPL